MHKKISNADTLAMDAKPDTNAVPDLSLFMAGMNTPISTPTALSTPEEMERELCSIRDEMWEVARLRSRGLTIPKIVAHYNNKYTHAEVSWIIKKVLNVNKHLALHDGDLLRQQTLDELDNIMHGLYLEAEEDGHGLLTSKQAPSALAVIDKKIKLLGINAPQKIDISISGTMSNAQEKLWQDIERFQNAIDVTPQEDELSDEELEEVRLELSMPNFVNSDITYDLPEENI